MKRSEELKQQDPFLSDPDDVHYEIHCTSCHESLWHTKILKRSGNRVVSTETKSCNEWIPKFDRRIEFCPLCGKRFYALSTTGGHMYLIKDMKCGIRRLV